MGLRYIKKDSKSCPLRIVDGASPPHAASRLSHSDAETQVENSGRRLAKDKSPSHQERIAVDDDHRARGRVRSGRGA